MPIRQFVPSETRGILARVVDLHLPSTDVDQPFAIETPAGKVTVALGVGGESSDPAFWGRVEVEGLAAVVPLGGLIGLLDALARGRLEHRHRFGLHYGIVRGDGVAPWILLPARRIRRWRAVAVVDDPRPTSPDFLSPRPSRWLLLSGGLFATTGAWGLWLITSGPITTPMPYWAAWQLVLLASVPSVLFFANVFPNPLRLLGPLHPKFMWFLMGRSNSGLKWLGGLLDIARLAPILLTLINIGPGAF